MPQPDKIALILAGGGSLGAFEAGVVTELFHQLERLNRDGSGPIEIDIITGGSAGSLVGALAARYLLDGPTDDPLQNPMFRAWVDEIDMRVLLPEAPRNAVFSKEGVYRILRSGLVRNPQAGAILHGNGAPFSCAPEVLRLAMTLSNMNGLTYRIPLLRFGQQASQRNFVTTVFNDLATFLIEKADPEATDWDAVGKAAVASGNLPLAFQPEHVVRDAADYPGAVEVSSVELLQRGLAFLDGGLFDNKPVGEAIRLAREADGGPNDRRLFLLVDPRLDTSRHDPDICMDSSLPDQLRRIASMIRDQSIAREWLRVARRNQELDWRDQLVEKLATLVDKSSTQVNAELLPQLQELAESIVDHKRQLFGEARYPADYLETSLELQKMQPGLQNAELLFVSSGDKQRIFRLITFILNNTGGLQNKSDLRLAWIGADKRQLAGDEFHGLLGFFDRELREHDFEVGCFQAKSLLPSILEDSFGVTATPTTPPTPPALRDFGIEHTDRETREELVDQLVLIIGVSLKKMGIPGRGALRLWLRSWLRGRLKL